MPFVKESGDDAKAVYIKGMSQTGLRNYKGRLTLQSYQLMVLMDVTPLVELIAPILRRFILADQDFLPWQRKTYQAAKEPKSHVDIKGDHFSPYTISK
ncbi:hypothetical protein Z517_12455 [Fonsecaea pedrosoi CBS 271.37]|uniref:Unplaced genomic scaffold supercont1.9, whole genome shotgun sequence n=1 Tax=Fonsecaea pedrosoi CBS 271.37 TaxID=1442368 RepID=A0A0D2G756_9EURO|nr:uncharacterized protein Z517_12455 [Fonsecaea pedrosoi CBS 271.37]KIW74515.1 hypothetical protein Z517_12455 [Fonsecaea pedrosoi CBS 271.37]